MDTVAESAKNHRPAHVFAARFNLQGIAHDYVLPADPAYHWEGYMASMQCYENLAAQPDALAAQLRAFGSARNVPPPTLADLDADNTLHANFTAFVLEAQHQERLRFYDRIAALNPAEAAEIAVNRNSRAAVTNALEGMLSGFTPKDIRYFTKASGEMTPTDLLRFKSSHAEERRRRAEKKIMAHLGCPGEGMGWVASPATLQIIWEQIKERHATPPDAANRNATGGQSLA